MVDDLDLETGIALVHAENPEWTTSPRSTVDISILRTLESYQPSEGITANLGEVEVTSQVVGYLRKLPSGEVLDHVQLELPPQTLVTKAVWYTVSDELLTGSAPGGAGLDPARIPGLFTPPSTRRSACYRSSRPVTAGTSAGCPPLSTSTPGRQRCSCTMGTLVGLGSPIAVMPLWSLG